MAAEFGSRVDQETTAAESNGVICCRWSWWLEHQPRLPLPCQLVVGLLPIALLYLEGGIVVAKSAVLVASLPLLLIITLMSVHFVRCLEAENPRPS